MYLKSIEVFGFKSFAHKVKFEFHDGITGIVGPNGSGKSNVADAVRWVLGEQSAKQLRGSSMQDVIFAGTENRKPLSYAYVALTLDNSDHVLPIEYEEVTVARRVYRSGESEYLMNGSPCRLKDVNELFFDTGVGKEGYSIIGQGQIEKILSGKPEDRRELFDEAVGIVKFKKRKAAAVKKLESERENLVRVNDILTEQERRIGPLSKQSEEAKAYLKYKEELKRIDVNSFLLEINSLNEQLDEIEKNFGIAQSQMESSKQQQQQIIVSYDALEQEINTLEARILDLKDQQSNTTLTKGKLESQILVLEEQIKAANAAEDTREERIAEIEADKKTKEEFKIKYETENKELSAVLNEVSGRLEKAQNDYSNLQQTIVTCNEKIDANNNEIMRLLSDRALIKSKEQHYETMLEQTNIRKAKLTQRLLERKTREQDFDVALALATDDYNETSASLKELQAKEQDYSHKYVEWKNKRRTVSEELQSKKDEFARVSSRLESLKNIAEHYDGYGNSIKKVMEQKDNNKGILGVVSDLIHVDKKYEVAIETALGGNIQNIVTEDEACAKKMINFLKDNRLGKATFLPLTSVKGKGNFKKQEFLQEKGVIGLASTLVDAEAKYDGVVDYLLGRVIVCEDIDHGIALAKKSEYSLHIVTIEGEYFSPGGSISGGRFKNNSNLLSRNREIEDLEKKLTELSKSIDEFTNRINEIETAQALLEADREDNNTKLSEVAILVNTASMNLERAKEQKAESLVAYEGLSKEGEEIEQQLKDIADGKVSIEKEKIDSDEREIFLKSENEKLANKVDEQTYMETAAARTLSEIQIEEANARQKVDFVALNIERITAEINKCNDDILAIRENAKTSKEEVEQKVLDIEDIKKTIMASNEAYSKLEETIRDAVKKKDELSSKYKGFFEQREALSETILEIEKELVRLESKREKTQNNISYRNDYMWEEYELTLHNAEALRDPEMLDLDFMKSEAVRIKDAIKKMGNVNVNAIEEYKELSERYNFLKAQHDDLVEAEATLVQIIEELDNGMRKQFNEGFARIQIEFDKAFKELFGGGKGTLELVEDEDILDTGIRIIAQPPGKKLQNMMQLSGGEKSLTAIALLFAIQNMKPSPFCLLDEIEAALDDANVDRFARYLNKLTKNTQFIIITHRRGTMNAADRLYGITMQEKGVSALVSVNLIEDKLDD